MSDTAGERTHILVFHHKITLNFTEEEYALLESRARHYNLETDEYISRRLLFKRTPKDRVVLFTTLAKVLIEISNRLDAIGDKRPSPTFSREIKQLRRLLLKFGQQLEPYLDNMEVDEQ